MMQTRSDYRLGDSGNGSVDMGDGFGGSRHEELDERGDALGAMARWISITISSVRFPFLFDHNALMRP